MPAHVCPNCGAPIPIAAPGAIEHCPFCGAETREAPAPAPSGAHPSQADPSQAAGPQQGSTGVGFEMVRHAVADAAGNIYCAGAFHQEVSAVWAYDRDLRLRWKVVPARPCAGLALHAPGTVTIMSVQGERRDARTLSAEDGSPGDAPGPLAVYRQALLDADGTYVVARIDPTQDWKEVPLFAAKGFFARMGSRKLDFSGHVWVALASDGDLVVHHGGVMEYEMHFSRFDRQGRRKFKTSVGVEGMNEPKLVPGVDGIVWAKSFMHLRAITPTAVTEVSLPSEGEFSIADVDLKRERPLLDSLDDAFVSMPDGSLVFFGFGPHDPGHIIRATTNGPTITRMDPAKG